MNILLVTFDFNKSVHGISVVSRNYFIKLIQSSLVNRVDILTSGLNENEDILLNTTVYRDTSKVHFDQYNFVFVITWHHELAEYVFEHCPPEKIVYFSHCVSFSNDEYPFFFRKFRKIDNYGITLLSEKISKIKLFIHLSSFSDDNRFADSSLRIPDFILPNTSRFEGSVISSFKPKKCNDDIYQLLLVSNLTIWKNHLGVLLVVFYMRIFFNKRIHLTLCFNRPNSLVGVILFYIIKISKQILPISYIVNPSFNTLIGKFNDSDLFFSYSLSECQPLVLVDSIYFGLPYLALDRGCISQMQGGMTFKSFLSACRLLNSILVFERLSELSKTGKSFYSSYHSERKFSDTLNKILQYLANDNVESTSL